MDGTSETWGKDAWTAFWDTLAEGPDAVALLNGATAGLGFADLIARRAAWSRSVAQLGLTGSHRVAAVLPDGIDTAVATLALLDRVRLIPLNPELAPEAMADMIVDARADAVMLPHDHPDDALAQDLFTRGIPVLFVNLAAATITLPGGAIGPARETGTPGLILSTSGSTGTPKRVPLNPLQLLLSARTIAAHLKLGPSDRALHMLPMFHVGAIVDLLLAPLLSGGSVAIAPGLNGQNVANAALRLDATWLQLVPTALARLLTTATAETGQAMGRKLRFVRMVSADLPDPMRHDAESLLSGVPVIAMYGMTETAGQLASQPLPPAPRAAGSVGRISGPEVAILDDTGSFVAPDRAGEICGRGPSVTAGYEGDAPIPRHGEWLRTGIWDGWTRTAIFSSPGAPRKSSIAAVRKYRR